MTVLWPREREAVNQHSMNVTASFKTEDDFRQFLDTYTGELTSTFDDAVNWIVLQGGEVADFEQKIVLVGEQLNLQNLPDNISLLMTWACAVALARSPTLQTWKNVRNLKSNSWQLENYLINAMLVLTERNVDSRIAYKDLAKQVFSELENFTLVSQFSSTNKEREGAFVYWTECQNKLDEIWWGLRRWPGFMMYESELPLFQVLHKLDPDEFTNVLAQSNNPYLVYSILFVSGIGVFSPRFSEWKELTIKAPAAFETDGKWNGSILLPLLLVDVRDQLLHGQRSIFHLDSSNADVEIVKNEIIKVAKATIKVLSMRHDAQPLFKRWSTWLMRQLLNYSEKEVDDVRTSAFVDSTLIEMIGSQLKNKSAIQVTSSDASIWEEWCYRCVLASHANSGFITPPDSSSFLAEWVISPDEWIEARGRSLRERVSFISPINKEMPGLSAQLLAYPIAQSECPAEIWINLWNATHSIREIVEFGDLDANRDEYHARTEAGKIILFVFRIGLAILDQRVQQCTSSDSTLARSQAKLHEALASAMLEMREIDDTLNQEEWFLAFRHLVVRRLIWADQHSNQVNPYRIFRYQDIPMVSDYLIVAKSDPSELVAVLQSALLNTTDITHIQNALNTAGINLTDVLAIIKRLNNYNPRKYPIDEAQLKAVEQLI
jgi:hypothetical protein